MAKKIKVSLKPKKVNLQVITQPQVVITKSQGMLNEILNDKGKLWGTGKNLPKLDNTLNSGEGLIKNGDYTRKTGRMFGLR